VKLLIMVILLSNSLTVIEAKEIKAKLAWFNVTTLSFRVNGIVTGLHVKAGDVVKSHQKLINLDQREYKDNVLSTKSLEKSRKSELDEAKRELDRATELFDRTVLSEHELQTTKNKYIASETDYVTAKTNWINAKRDLEFSTITAPFNAVVLDIVINKNETVVSSFKSSPAIVIAEANKIAAKFMLSADDVAQLKSGESVTVSIAGNSYKGILFFPSMLAVDGLFPVAVVVEVDINKAHAGQTAMVKF